MRDPTEGPTSEASRTRREAPTPTRPRSGRVLPNEVRSYGAGGAALSYQSNLTPNLAMRGPRTVVAFSKPAPDRQSMFTAVLELAALKTSKNSRRRQSKASARPPRRNIGKAIQVPHDSRPLITPRRRFIPEVFVVCDFERAPASIARRENPTGRIDRSVLNGSEGF